MNRLRWPIRITVAVVATVAVTAIVLEVRRKKLQADAAVGEIEAQLDALDPVTRAAVVARVGAKSVRRPGVRR
jgi:hypothetical protein